ncbi:MAG: hypothetical protein V1750_03150 [Acidobacteriota bacterium]
MRREIRKAIIGSGILAFLVCAFLMYLWVFPVMHAVSIENATGTPLAEVKIQLDEKPIADIGSIGVGETRSVVGWYGGFGYTVVSFFSDSQEHRVRCDYTHPFEFSSAQLTKHKHIRIVFEAPNDSDQIPLVSFGKDLALGAAPTTCLCAD